MEIKSNDSNKNRARKMRKKYEAIKSPDLSKMYTLELNDIHKTVYYFNTKEKMNKKIKKLCI